MTSLGLWALFQVSMTSAAMVGACIVICFSRPITEVDRKMAKITGIVFAVILLICGVYLMEGLA